MSLLDDWRADVPAPAPPPQLSASLAYFAGADVTADTGPPLFALEALERDARAGQGVVTAVAAAANVVLLGTANGALIRYDFAEGAASEVELAKPGTAGAVHALFLDPSARHALAVVRDRPGAAAPGDAVTYYVSAAARKGRPLGRLRGCAPTAAAWHPGAGEATTREVLLGTCSGCLYELQVDAGAGRERVFKLLLELRDREPVCGLFFDVSDPVAAPSPALRFSLLAVTPSRMYSLSGSGSLEALCAAAAAAGGGLGPEPAVELPGALDTSCLRVYTHGGGGGPADRFAWLSPAGLYTGSLEAPGAAAAASDDAGPGGQRLLPYPPPAGAPEGSAPGPPPLSIAATAFHLLLLYPDRLVALNLLAPQAPAAVLPLRRHVAPSAGALALVADASGGALYLATSEGLLEVVAREEGRHQWHLHTARREWAAAARLAPTPAAKETVALAQGDAAYKAGDLPAAARAFARAPSLLRFEDAALRLLGAGDESALRAYLAARLAATPKDQRAAATMLATWLAELYLHALATADADAAAAAAAGGAAGQGSEALAAEFRAFLQAHGAVLDAATTRRLLAEGGRAAEALQFAELRGDWATAAAAHLAAGNAAAAVGVLRRPGAPAELLYSTAPRLFALAPAAACELWLTQLAGGVASAPGQPGLDPGRLVPALAAARRAGAAPLPGSAGASDSAAALGETHRAQAVRFLEAAALAGCAAASVHNLLLALHADAADGDERGLLRYLRAARAGASATAARGAPAYDAAFALRTCLARGAYRAACELYCDAGALREAVEMAVSAKDLPLARSAAAREPDSDARKPLLLSIVAAAVRHARAEAVALGAGDADADSAGVKAAIAAIADSDGALAIEDVLPLCPDSCRVDDFRGAVTAALDSYACQVEALRAEMVEVASSADAIRADAASLEQRVLELPRDARCALCANLLTQAPAPPGAAATAGVPPFYAFPCGHAFEAGCLLEAALPLLGATQGRMARRAWSALADGVEGGAAALAVLEDGVACECPLCGEAAARGITAPFVDEGKEAELIASWAI